MSQCKTEQLCVGVEYSVLLTDAGQAYLFDIVNGKLSSLICKDTIVSASAGQEHILLLTDGEFYLIFYVSS